SFLVLFFFQAEDGIRDATVTGVQTCALPISAPAASAARRGPSPRPGGSPRVSPPPSFVRLVFRSGSRHTFFEQPILEHRLRDERSEERRVGKEWRAGRSREQDRKMGGVMAGM